MFNLLLFGILISLNIGSSIGLVLTDSKPCPISTEAHKGHHCKYFFRKVFFISARFFLFPQGYFLFPQGLFDFRKVCFISARFVLFPQGYFNFRENIFNGNHQGTARPRSFGVMARFEQ